MPGSIERHELYPEVRRIFDVSVQSATVHGLNLISDLWILADEKRTSLDPEGKQAFDELCAEGCNAIALSACLGISRAMPVVGRVFTRVFGEAKARSRSSKKLREAAEVLKHLGPEDYVRILEDNHGCDPKSPVGPITLAKNMEMFATILDLAELFHRKGQIKSRHDLPRFIVSDYVYQVTERWHDREVSALLQWDVADVYDETAHRVWRNRNYRRLRGDYRIFAELLIPLGQVIRDLSRIESE